MTKAPNNCATCEYKQHPQGSHCYMFREAPRYVCRQHTAITQRSIRTHRDRQQAAEIEQAREAQGDLL